MYRIFCSFVQNTSNFNASEKKILIDILSGEHFRAIKNGHVFPRIERVIERPSPLLSVTWDGAK